MLRIILGIVVGFIAWSIIWVGSDALIASFSPDWWRAQKSAMELAVYNGEMFRTSTTIYVLDLVRTGIASIMAGFLTTIVAGENRRSTVVLGIVLLVVGCLVQYHVFNVFPLWYHIIFLVLLIPLTILGGKMKQSA
jgi:hypothetical protein